MEDCEANCVVLRSLLGSCLSDIDKNIPLWHYGIMTFFYLKKKKIVVSLIY